MTTITARRWVRLGLGLALSAVALWLALRKTSLEQIGEVLGHVHWKWIPVMLSLKAAVLVVKDLRWKCELGAMQPGPFRGTFRAIGLGYFGNIILPFKLGELLRVGLLRRHNPQVGVGDALATIAAERALDGAILALMVAAVLHTVEVPAWVLSSTVILLAAMLSVIAVAMLTPLHRFLLARLPSAGVLGIGRKVVAALTRGTRVLRQPRALGLASFYTALAWMGEALVFYTAVVALDVPLGFTSALVVTLLLSVGLLVPSAPGQIGTHQALAVLFLVPFGVDETTAVSVSFLLQAIALTTLGSIGGYVLMREAAARELVRTGARGADPVTLEGPDASSEQ
ncbi:MAG TPA: lysylphosphatidylglycerol synthase transmembrane domain-containing protein [Kofleriaceae bacterium]|nr:lysylphosphatidylglycerol synthase transmembrane domain-containing protein [Kofleriaceae bacterium]